jgi:hypothetical protein
MPKIQLSCACGHIQGHTENVTAQSGNRVHCCCKDCQKFADFLEHDKPIMNEYGATDIFQMPISHVHLTQGQDQLGLMRLSPKGLNRWYAKCCNTPIGNTLGGKAPFIGVIHNFMQHSQSRDQELGQTRGHIHCQSANVPVPETQQASFFKVSMRVLAKLVSWKLKGYHQPSAFFDKHSHPVAKMLIAPKADLNDA